MLSSLFGPVLIGLLVAILSGWLLIPLLRALKARQTVSTDAPKSHQAKTGTPTMVGVIIVCGGLLAPLLYPHPGGLTGRLLAAILCTLCFGLVGFLDDLLIVLRGRNLGLRAREKLLGQFVVALLFVWWADFNPGHGAWSYAVPAAAPAVRWALALYHVLLLVGMSNAVNLTDGLDGLAAGVSLPVWLCLAVLAAMGGAAASLSDPGVLAFCAAFAGATLGYLWFNAHPAQVFMGDTGSLAIGGGLAAAAILLRQDWIILIAALVHLAEAGSVTAQVISFKTTGKRIFKMSPLHHHFELCGLPETRIVARFAIASTACALLALLVATQAG